MKETRNGASPKYLFYPTRAESRLQI